MWARDRTADLAQADNHERGTSTACTIDPSPLHMHTPLALPPPLHSHAGTLTTTHYGTSMRPGGWGQHVPPRAAGARTLPPVSRKPPLRPVYPARQGADPLRTTSRGVEVGSRAHTVMTA